MTDPHFNGAIQQLQKACLERKEKNLRCIYKTKHAVKTMFGLA